jgi:hypothetical protein
MDQPAIDTIPEPVRQYLTITEIDDAEFLVGELFRRKFGHPPPGHGRHLVALYSTQDGACSLAGYSNMWPFEGVYLSGGSCSNGETIRRMQAHEREAIFAAGGVLHLILKYAFRKYAERCDAFFGHCGDKRALEVTLAAGFVHTGYPPVIAHWHKPLAEASRQILTAKVVALGPF